MELAPFVMSWSPVVLLTLLAVVLKRPALELSIYGTVFSVILVGWYFDTPLSVMALAAVDGVLTTLPLLLVILAGIMLSTLLMTTGSLTRIVDWFMGGVKNAYHRTLLITFGVGNFMEGAGVIAEPVVAPMLTAAGVAPMGAAALSVVGYAGLMTLELAGIIITVAALVTGLPEHQLAVASAWLSIPALVMMAAITPIFLPKKNMNLKRFVLVLICGALVGLVALATTAYLSVSISGVTGGLAVILLLVFMGNRRLSFNREVLIDLAPFIFLLIALLLVNSVPVLKQLTFNELVIKVRFIKPHTITFRPFFSAYLYLFIALGLAVVLQPDGRALIKKVFGAGLAKGGRAAVAMGLFGAMGQIIAFSGYAPGFESLEKANNIPALLAGGLAAYSGSCYPIFVPLLGWVGTFLTGYGVASLMLFGLLQVQTAAILGVSATWLASGLAVGASLGSISSPFKVAIATPMCGALGQEGAILRWTIPLGAAASLLLGVVLWMVV